MFFSKKLDDGECPAYMSVQFCIDVSSTYRFIVGPVLEIIAEIYIRKSC